MEFRKPAHVGINRIFFAVAVPLAAGKQLLLRFQNQRVQLYQPENLHITLKFIGESAPDDIQRTSEIAVKVAALFPTFDISGGSYAIIDNRLRLILDESREFQRLFDIVTMALRKYGIGKIEPHAFTPHITLGRVDNSFSIHDADGLTSNFSISEFSLYKSVPGASGMGEYTKLQTYSLSGERIEFPTYTKIILPTRPQPDTLVAIFVLKKFGGERFPGIAEATLEVWPMLPDGETEGSLDKKGAVLIDVGGGRFDHHAVKDKMTASDLVASHLGVLKHPALSKLLEYARRDDFYGKGTISTDPLDRAFGLSALIANVNKILAKDPARVVDIIMPLIVAHFREEVRRTEELPREFEAKMRSGEVKTFEVRQYSKKLKVVSVHSENVSLAGYLRSHMGGKYDVVAQWLPSGHVNVLTRPAKCINLQMLAALVRSEEIARAGRDIDVSEQYLMQAGRIEHAPEWYYDPATNSLQNGGVNPKDTLPTRISHKDFNHMLAIGLHGRGLATDQ
jgi:2'-5' RNA ligase